MVASLEIHLRARNHSPSTTLAMDLTNILKLKGNLGQRHLLWLLIEELLHMMVGTTKYFPLDTGRYMFVTISDRQAQTSMEAKQMGKRLPHFRNHLPAQLKLLLRTD